MKKHPFKEIESYKHKAAKDVLAGWLNDKYDVEQEVKFLIKGRYVFVADLACYINGNLICLYEVLNKHQISGKKIGRIQSWAYRNFKDLIVYEIRAEWILSQINKPEEIKFCNKYEMLFQTEKDYVLQHTK